MDKEIKKEALKQYFRYFRVWFSGLAIFLVISIVSVFGGKTDGNVVRNNSKAPTERVFDQADLLTSTEEQKLRELIARSEEEIKADIVIVTIKQSMGSSAASQDKSMMKYADDFYDKNYFGYNKERGNGVLLLDNRYTGQEMRWLSTCGNVKKSFSENDISLVLDAAFYADKNGSYYDAYKAAIDTTVNLMKTNSKASPIPWWCILVFPIAAALIFAVKNLVPKKADVTTRANTYVPGGKPVVKVRRDDFMRKNVVTRRIETNNGGGNGGSHISGSGVSHGGGGRRG